MALFLNQAWQLVRKEKRKKNKIQSKEILRDPEGFREACTARPQRDFNKKSSSTQFFKA